MSKDHKNLITILKIFKNRPNHLCRFLLENKAFNKKFLDKIESNDKLSEVNPSKIGGDHFYFSNVSEMKSYYASLIDDLESINLKKDREILKRDLQERLNSAVLEEDYEEAKRINDFMILNKLK